LLIKYHGAYALCAIIDGKKVGRLSHDCHL
jgi:hypothetical protein